MHNPSIHESIEHQCGKHIHYFANSNLFVTNVIVDGKIRGQLIITLLLLFFFFIQVKVSTKDFIKRGLDLEDQRPKFGFLNDKSSSRGLNSED